MNIDDLNLYHRLILNLFSENDRENDMAVKEKLSEALQKKIYQIEHEREKIEEEKKRIEKMTQKQKDKNQKQIKRKESQKKGLQGNKKTSIAVERDAHEAYQLILSEYHRRVKQRMKQKTRTLAVMKISMAAKPTDTEKSVSEKTFGFWINNN